MRVRGVLGISRIETCSVHFGLEGLKRLSFDVRQCASEEKASSGKALVVLALAAQGVRGVSRQIRHWGIHIIHCSLVCSTQSWVRMLYLLRSSSELEHALDLARHFKSKSVLRGEAG